MKKFKLPTAIIMSVVSFAILIFLIWALLFFSYYSAFLAFLGFLVFLPIKINSKHFWLIRAVVFLTGLMLLVTTIHIPIGEINNRIDSLAKKTISKNSLSSFSLRDKIGIYGLNLWMGLFAYPIYLEVSKETLMLVLPPPKNGVRTFHSDFAIKSEKIKNVIKEFKNALITYQSENTSLQKQIYWSLHENSFGKKEARYALALNPAYISLNASKKDSGWLIDVSIKVKVSYPQRSYVTLLSKPELKVEEGLFWVLQNTGWLFPYTAVWEFSINSNDAMIN